jgi:hypothetical protein
LAVKVNKFFFLNEEIDIKQANEPTDIIWENRHIRSRERKCRGVLVIIVMAILAAGTFAAIYILLQQKLLNHYRAEPPGIDCRLVLKSFGEEDLRQLAYKEA